MAKRRRRGHIRRRGPASFQALAYAGLDPITKKPRYLAETAPTHAEAEKALTRLLAQVDQQRTPATAATVAHLIRRWLEVADLELTTRDGYEGYIRRNILPVLGETPLRRLDTATLDRFYAHVRAHGGRCHVCAARARQGLAPLRPGERYRPMPDAPEVTHKPDCARGLPLAPSSVRQVHAIMRQALNQAVKWGWLPSNPATLASPPKATPQEPEPPSPEQVARLLNAAWAKDEDFGMLLWLAMTTGARRGELCALRWSHVHLRCRGCGRQWAGLDEAHCTGCHQHAPTVSELEAHSCVTPARAAEGELLIARSYVVRRTGRREKDTKTHQRRRIALDEATLALLAEHLERCRDRAAIYGCALAPDGYVFSRTPDGRIAPLPDSISQRVYRLARRLGMPGRHLHEFRHYSATQLLANGVDLRTVAGRLGHSGGGAVTLRVYAAFMPAPDRRAADLLGGSIPRPRLDPQ